MDVAQGPYIWVAEERVILEADFGIEADKRGLLGHHERVDLDEARILLNEQRV